MICYYISISQSKPKIPKFTTGSLNVLFTDIATSHKGEKHATSKTQNGL